MITFLITPVKSKRDSLLFETPAQKLTFDVADTPALFDSLHQLKQLQSARRNTLCVLESAVKRPRPLHSLQTPRRKSLCSLQTPHPSMRALPFSTCTPHPKQRKSLCSLQTPHPSIHDLPFSTVTPHIKQLQRAQTQPTQQQQPLSPLSDYESNPFDALEFLQCADNDGLTPANLFNATINKISEQQLDEKEGEEHHDTDIIASTQYNNQFCITMLITNSSPSQQKIQQYLIEKNKGINPRGINLIESCCCSLCQQRNWNLVDIRWEKQWQIQQFQFIFDVDMDDIHECNICNVRQICATQCEYVTDILLSNGILQQDEYMDAINTFDRKMIKKSTSNNHSARKKKPHLSKAKTMMDELAKDKKIILQHLATWSQSTDLLELSDISSEISSESVISQHCPEKFLPISDQEAGCLFISHETLRGLMDGSVDTQLFDYFVIVDCRYEYEYLGGHISGAVNVSDKLLMELLFKANMNIKEIPSQRIAWIFHCEYSKHRGPQTCKYFRKLDREINEYRYPYVSYPHVYVLQGGYKRFWNNYKYSYWTLKDNLFTPYGYMSMWNDVFDDQRFIYSQFRKNVWKKSTKKQESKLCHKKKN